MSFAAFKRGVHESTPICISFFLIFFSVGALYNQQGFSFFETALGTVIIFAGPLQVAAIQDVKAYNFIAVALLSILINFRFLLMSAVMTQYFTGVNRAKVILSLMALSASPYTVTHSELSNNRQFNGHEQFSLYLGVALPSYFTAILATIIGYSLPNFFDYQLLLAYSVMLLPLHFVSLTALRAAQLAKSKNISLPVLATIIGVIMAPLMNSIDHKVLGIITPILLGIGLAVYERRRAT